MLPPGAERKCEKQGCKPARTAKETAPIERCICIFKKKFYEEQECGCSYPEADICCRDRTVFFFFELLSQRGVLSVNYGLKVEGVFTFVGIADS